MKLNEWRKKHNLTFMEFSRKIEIPYSTVYKHCTEERDAEYPFIRKYHAFTNGEVDANDFVGLNDQA